jgi:hypothetical protein
MPGGVGTELKELLASLGLRPSAKCTCHARAAEMDEKGIAWVRDHRDEILGWLRKEQARRGWLQILRAGALAVVSGLAFQLDPRDPAVGLLNEALRRAEEKERG